MLAEDTVLGPLPPIAAVDVAGDLILLADRLGALHLLSGGRASSETALLPGPTAPISAMRLSPSGLSVALASEDGWVQVHILRNLFSGGLRHPEVVAAHRQHRGGLIEHLCWSADSCKVYSGCSDGLVVEMLLTAARPSPHSAPPLMSLHQISSAFSSWLPSSGVTIVCHHPRERTRQLTSCLSEVSSGASDM